MGYSSRPKLVVIERCEGRSMGGDGLGSVSSGPMPRPVASLKVSRWFGEGLRQWRRPSRASSAIPCTRVTGGTAYGGGGGGAAAAFHRSRSVPYFIWWGRWRRPAMALEYALGSSDPAVVGALELPWPVGVQAASGGSGESPASARGAPAAPAATTTSESVSAEFTPGSQTPTGVGGKRARRARTCVQAPGVRTTGGADTNAPRVRRRVVGLGRSLLVRRHHAAIPALCLGCARTRRPAPKRRHPDGLSGGPARKAASHPQSKRQRHSTGAGSNGGGGGVSWKFAPRGSDSRNPICL